MTNPPDTGIYQSLSCSAQLKLRKHQFSVQKHKINPWQSWGGKIRVRYCDLILSVSHKTPRMDLKFYFYFQYTIIMIKEWSAATTETSGWLCVDIHTQMIYFNHQGFQHETLDPEILNQTKKLRKFCLIQAWLSFFQTRWGAQCRLTDSSITGVPRLCVNIGINVQRANRHTNILLFGHSQLGFHSFKPPSSLLSVQFAESGSLYWGGTVRHPWAALPLILSIPGLGRVLGGIGGPWRVLGWFGENGEGLGGKLGGSGSRFGNAWPDPKQLPARVQLSKWPPKLALHCSGSHLGNSKASESNCHCSTAVLIQTLPIQMYSCASVGNGKSPKLLSPSTPEAAPLQTLPLPALFVTKHPNNRVLFPACSWTIASLITSKL